METKARPSASGYARHPGQPFYYYENEMTPEEIFRMMFGDFAFAGKYHNHNSNNILIIIFFFKKKPINQ